VSGGGSLQENSSAVDKSDLYLTEICMVLRSISYVNCVVDVPRAISYDLSLICIMISYLHMYFRNLKHLCSPDMIHST